jgi:hypothetical protein
MPDAGSGAYLQKPQIFLDQIMRADKYIERNRAAIRATQRKRDRNRTARLDSHAAVSRWEGYQFRARLSPAEACSIDRRPFKPSRQRAFWDR